MLAASARQQRRGVSALRLVSREDTCELDHVEMAVARRKGKREEVIELLGRLRRRRKPRPRELRRLRDLLRDPDVSHPVRADSVGTEGHPGPPERERQQAAVVASGQVGPDLRTLCVQPLERLDACLGAEAHGLVERERRNGFVRFRAPVPLGV